MGQAPGGEGLCTKRGRSSVLNMLSLRLRETPVETRRAGLPRPDGEASGLSWRCSGVFCPWLVFKGMRSDGVCSLAEDLKIGSRDIPALLAVGEKEAPAKEMEREQPARGGTPGWGGVAATRNRLRRREHWVVSSRRMGWARWGLTLTLRLGPCRSSVALVKTGECHVGLVAMATEARLEWVEGEAAGEDWRQRLFTTAFEKLCCKGEQNVG